jgi:hypothetical protein
MSITKKMMRKLAHVKKNEIKDFQPYFKAKCCAQISYDGGGGYRFKTLCAITWRCCNFKRQELHNMLLKHQEIEKLFKFDINKLGFRSCSPCHAAKKEWSIIGII